MASETVFLHAKSHFLCFLSGKKRSYEQTPHPSAVNVHPVAHNVRRVQRARQRGVAVDLQRANQRPLEKGRNQLVGCPQRPVS